MFGEATRYVLSVYEFFACVSALKSRISEKIKGAMEVDDFRVMNSLSYQNNKGRTSLFPHPFNHHVIRVGLPFLSRLSLSFAVDTISDES